MRRLSGILMLMLVLAACGGNGGNNTDTPNTTAATDTVADTTTQNDPSTGSDNVGFTATITGATEATVSGRGYFQCDDIDDGELTLGAAFSMSDNVLIMFPAGVEPGTYDLETDTGMPGEFSAMYVGEDMMTATYEDNVSGTLTLEEIARASGETVRGNFQFTVSSSEGETVDVTGEFDFAAGENAYFNCTESD
jgi:hypothetical protein